jgi:rare lipoprotein A
MKRLNAALIFGLIFSGLCFAQTQTGNASYNGSKNGVTIAHSSMSFGTRVKVTNLRNNREVIATVDGRIPVSDPRIADISAEAGDAIGMSRSGYTEVRLEQLIHQVSAAEPSPAVETAVVRTAAPADTGPKPPDAAPRSSTPPQPEPVLSPASEEPKALEPVQPMAPPPAAGTCLFSPLCIVFLILLIIITLLLTAIFILLLSARCFWQPWYYYPVWLRRHIRYIKKRRR